MRLLAENSTDAAKEKHVPVIEHRPDGILVRVGSVAHPMEADHYIEWIELQLGAPEGVVGATYRAQLRPGDKPEAFFRIVATDVRARELCNKHGLWKA
jgi:superoxide reductase